MLILIVGLGSSTGCLTSPIVSVVGDKDIDKPPKIGERVEVVTSDGYKLRGLFISAGKEAPLVLNFLPSGVSISKGLKRECTFYPMTKQLRKLRDEGFSSFIMEYRGVGASEGCANPETIPQDAELIWSEALKRVSGQSKRVVVRSASLGTLASIQIMEKFHPAGISLVAPIQPQTINQNIFRRSAGSFLASIINFFFKVPTQQNLVEASRSTTIPLLITVPKRDELFPPEEVEPLITIVKAKNETVTISAESHQDLVLNYIGWEMFKDGDGGLSTFYGGNLVKGEIAFFKKVLGMEE